MAIAVLNRGVNGNHGELALPSDSLYSIGSEQRQTSGLGPDPCIPEAVSGDREHMRIGQAVNLQRLPVAYTKQPGAGADEDRAVLILDHAGDQFGIEIKRSPGL